MTQDDVIRIATETGLCTTSNGFIDWVDAGPSAYEMGEENERDIVCTLIYSMVNDNALANKLVDTIRVRQ